MPYQSGKPVQREIAAVAARQGGYFTTQQAEKLGYERRRLAYHVAAGNFERVGQGLYRLPSFPLAEHDDLVRATLWSRNRQDGPQAVVSHRTALALHGLSDLFAGGVHLTVPAGFRKRPPRGWFLHRGELAPSDTEEREGFKVTTPLRTLLDLSDSEGVGDEEYHKAVHDALEQGLVSRKKLVAEAERASATRLLRVLNAGQ